MNGSHQYIHATLPACHEAKVSVTLLLASIKRNQVPGMTEKTDPMMICAEGCFTASSRPRTGSTGHPAPSQLRLGLRSRHAHLDHRPPARRHATRSDVELVKARENRRARRRLTNKPPIRASDRAATRKKIRHSERATGRILNRLVRSALAHAADEGEVKEYPTI